VAEPHCTLAGQALMPHTIWEHFCPGGVHVPQLALQHTSPLAQVTAPHDSPLAGAAEAATRGDGVLVDFWGVVCTALPVVFATAVGVVGAMAARSVGRASGTEASLGAGGSGCAALREGALGFASGSSLPFGGGLVAGA